MIVKTVTEMDTLIERNPRLSWDGWNVVHSVPDEYGEFVREGMFNKAENRWYIQRIIPPGPGGWDIPDRLL